MSNDELLRPKHKNKTIKNDSILIFTTLNSLRLKASTIL